jgi:hypothetical protein
MAVGARFWTLMVTEAAVEFVWPSFTTSEKVNVLAVDGAVNVGFELEAPLRVTAGPDVCVQMNVKGSPSGSVLLLPSSVTVAFLKTVCPAPAFALGGLFVEPPPPPQAVARSTKPTATAQARSRPNPCPRKVRPFLWFFNRRLPPRSCPS